MAAELRYYRIRTDFSSSRGAWDYYRVMVDETSSEHDLDEFLSECAQEAAEAFAWSEHARGAHAEWVEDPPMAWLSEEIERAENRAEQLREEAVHMRAELERLNHMHE